MTLKALKESTGEATQDIVLGMYCLKNTSMIEEITGTDE